MRNQFCEDYVYSLGTAEEIGDLCLKMMMKSKKFQFPAFSFAVSPNLAEGDLEDYYTRATGFYGVQEFETMMNRGNYKEVINVCADYYGGGCCETIQLWQDELYEESNTQKAIANLILRSIGIQESVNKNTQFIVQWEPDTYVEIEVDPLQEAYKILTKLMDKDGADISDCWEGIEEAVGFIGQAIAKREGNGEEA